MRRLFIENHPLKRPEDRTSQSERLKAYYKAHPEAGEAHSARLKIIQGTPEARAANSVAQKIAKNRPEARAANSARMKIIQGTPEARAANSARGLLRFSSSEAVAAQSAAMKNGGAAKTWFTRRAIAANPVTIESDGYWTSADFTFPTRKEAIAISKHWYQIDTWQPQAIAIEPLKTVKRNMQDWQPEEQFEFREAAE